jgi:NAD(P)-dependent dehydrogenase (short-subunit alcohol dehydrogenase family)
MYSARSSAAINAHKGIRRHEGRGRQPGKTLSADLVERGVRVNAISPGPVESALQSRLGMSAEQLRQTQDWIKSQVLIKRLAKPEEIAEAVLYLSSSGSAFVVGAEIVIDGGMTL